MSEIVVVIDPVEDRILGYHLLDFPKLHGLAGSPAEPGEA
jgi:hypothetical protein